MFLQTVLAYSFTLGRMEKMYVIIFPYLNSVGQLKPGNGKRHCNGLKYEKMLK